MQNTLITQYRRRIVDFGRKPTENTQFLENAIVQWISILVGMLVFFAFVLLFFNIKPTEALIKLQYNVYFGASVRSSWWSPYILIAMGIVFYLIDLVLAFILYNEKFRIGAYVLLLGGFFAHIGLLVAVISIIMNN